MASRAGGRQPNGTTRGAEPSGPNDGGSCNCIEDEAHRCGSALCAGDGIAVMSLPRKGKAKGVARAGKQPTAPSHRQGTRFASAAAIAREHSGGSIRETTLESASPRLHRMLIRYAGDACFSVFLDRSLGCHPSCTPPAAVRCLQCLHRYSICRYSATPIPAR